MKETGLLFRSDGEINECISLRVIHQFSECITEKYRQFLFCNVVRSFNQQVL